MYIKYQPVYFFITGFAYSFILILTKRSFDSFPTIGFILFALFAIYQNILSTNYTKHLDNYFYRNLLPSTVLLSLGIILGCYVTNAPENSLWMNDSVTTHNPSTLRFIKLFNNFNSELFKKAITTSGAITHFTVAVFFYLFGKSIFISSLALLFLKTITTAVIYKLSQAIFDSKTAVINAILYALSPMVLFYTLVFYKEASIQLFVALTYLSIYKVFYKQSTKYIPWIIIAIAALYLERFYLSIILLSTIVLISFKSKRFLLVSLLGTTITGFYFYSNSQYLGKSSLTIINQIRQLRELHLSYNDMSASLNYNIAYPLAFIKTILTPFFTLNKFKIFYDFSYLLIWGSFIHQLTAVIAAVSFLKNWQKDKILHTSFILPFIIFISMTAYISPWAGRIRDSFYPLIILYTGYLINEYKNKD